MSQNKVPMITEDGSSTIFIPEWNESYHSRHGAIAESRHVFIENGIATVPANERIIVVEVGLGTGLNALLTYEYSVQYDVQVDYHAIEPFPLSYDVCSGLNYPVQLQREEYNSVLREMHSLDKECVQLGEHFQFYRYTAKLLELKNHSIEAGIVYYDAFGPRVQPEMWMTDNLSVVTAMMKSKGILVTYCAQGEFRRNLMRLGYSVERLKGPPGKREMIRATKNED